MMMFAATVLLKLRLGPWLFRLYFHELFLYRSRFAALLQGNQIGASTSPESNVQFNITGRGKKQSHTRAWRRPNARENGARAKIFLFGSAPRGTNFSRGF